MKLCWMDDVEEENPEVVLFHPDPVLNTEPEMSLYSNETWLRTQDSHTNS